MEIDGLWQRYWDDEPGARDDLVTEYLPLVRYVASTIGVPSHVEHADLESYGIFGLMDAIERFKPELGFKFETYGVTRIRGAILDHLRSIDWVPRAVRSKARRFAHAVSELETSLNREPTMDEVASHLGISPAELADDLAQAAGANQSSLDEHRGDDGEQAATLGERLGDASVEELAFASALEGEVRAALVAALPRLPDTDRLILALHYLEEMSLGEIAQVLSVTESRACQLAARAALSLRNALVELAHA